MRCVGTEKWWPAIERDDPRSTIWKSVSRKGTFSSVQQFHLPAVDRIHFSIFARSSKGVVKEDFLLLVVVVLSYRRSRY